MGSMYAAVLFIGVKNGNSVQPVVAVERTVFYRERAAGMYSALPYAFAQVRTICQASVHLVIFLNLLRKITFFIWSINLYIKNCVFNIIFYLCFVMQFHLLLQVLIEVPYAFVQAMVYDVIVYVLIGFEWTAAKFFWYLFFTYFSLLYFTFYGMMTVAVTPNYHISSIIASAFYTIWNLFSGFIVPRPVSFSTLFQLYSFFFFPPLCFTYVRYFILLIFFPWSFILLLCQQ